MEDDQVIEMMRRFKTELLSREATRMAEMTRAWVGVEERLQGSIDALTADLARRQADGEVITQAALFRLQRYQSLLVQIQQELNSYEAYAQGQIEAAQLEFGEAAIEHTAANIVQSGVAQTSFTRLPREAAELMVGSLSNGSPLNTLLLNAAVRADVVDKMTSALLNGTALGTNPRKTSRQMRDHLAGGLNQALTIARTEQMRVYREMTDQSYQASGVVEGKYRLTARDDRVCMACLARDGEFIPLGTPMEEHPNGRCTTVAAIVGQPAPQRLNARDWFSQQDEATQRTMMGDARYEAWQDGRFKLSELATGVRGRNGFGRSLQVTPLRDL